MSNQPFGIFLSKYFGIVQDTCNLYIICIGRNIRYLRYLGFIDMTEGEMFEQIGKSKNTEFFLQQIGTVRSYPFEVFDWRK